MEDVSFWQLGVLLFLVGIGAALPSHRAVWIGSIVAGTVLGTFTAYVAFRVDEAQPAAGYAGYLVVTFLFVLFTFYVGYGLKRLMQRLL